MEQLKCTAGYIKILRLFLNLKNTMPQKNNFSSVYIPKQSELFQNEPKNSSGHDKQVDVLHGEHDRFAVIEASAGTGKTFALVELVLELLLEQEIPLKSILLVTFTEKATAELRLRLRSKLRELLETCEKNNTSFKTVPEGPFWEINTLRKERLKAALLDFDSAPVYTIHGFCKRVLREFAFENRQLFEQQLCDTNLLFSEVFRRYLRRELLSQNTPVSQLFAFYVKYTEGNLDTLERDIRTLISRDGEFIPNLPVFDVFLKEFTEYWEALVAKDRNLRSHNLTQHPICSAFEVTALNGSSMGKTLRNLNLLLETLGEAHSGESTLVNLLGVFDIELAAVTTPKCRKNLMPGEQWHSQEEFPEPERDWIEAVADCENLLLRCGFSGGAKKILKTWVTQQVLKDVRHELEQTKLEQGTFDFDDLLRLVEEQVLPLDDESPVPTLLTKAVRKKYVCAIVDEFQDTDRRQWSIFRHLFFESPEHRLIVIGDPKQAIYSFRGADIFAYLQARKTFEEKTSRQPFTLKKNFRSSAILLSGLNRIFSGDSWFPDERGILYQRVGCGKPELELQDETPERNAIHLLELLPQFTVSGKKIAEQRKLKKPKIPLEILDSFNSLLGKKYFGKKDFMQAAETVLKVDISELYQSALLSLFLDDQAENATSRFAEAIALEIKTLLRIGISEIERPVWKYEEGERPLREQDVCVLFRKSSEGETLGKALRRHGIDFAFYKQKGLFTGREAKEILDLLEAVAHPTDHSRTAKVWLTRFFGANIQELAQTPTWGSDLLHQLQQWNSFAEARRFRRLFEEILQNTKLVERELLLGGDERSVTNYVHLFEVLNRQVMERHLDLFELIQLLRRFIEGKEDPGENETLLRLESERDAVQLMTMHAAKGLEFPVVFLFGGLTGNKKESIQFYHDADENLVIDLLSSAIPTEHQWQVEAEQQRLLYVAMTRACGRLYLPYSGYLTGNSEKRVCKVSGAYSFVNEQLTAINEQLSIAGVNSAFSRSIVGNYAVNKQEDIKTNVQEKLRTWKPPLLPANPAIFGDTNDPEESFSQLRYKKRGFVVSSFTRMDRKKDAEAAGIKESVARNISPVEIRSETDLGERRENDETDNTLILETQTTIPDPTHGTRHLSHKAQKDLLPGGVQTGNLLHELLELVDFNTIQESSSPQEWLALPPVHRLIDSFRERFERSAETVPRIAEIIWRTLRTPVRLGKTQDDPKLELAGCKRYLREADFYFPIPEEMIQMHNRFPGTKAPDCQQKNEINVEGWQVEKGFLRGSIDFLFEHEGLIYLLDWKSNMLADYSVETVEREVIEHYQLQLQIYTIATSYWFKLKSEEKYNEKFGGVLYIFLRGMSQKIRNSGGEGVFFKRPTWQELKGYENRLCLENY